MKWIGRDSRSRQSVDIQRTDRGTDMENDALEFFKKFDDAKKMFFKVFRQAKKEIILQDEDDFAESMGELLVQNYGLSEDDAEKYASLIYEIWEDCSCSMTSFDREMTSVKEALSPIVA